jgi:hypothetical protein
MTVSNDWSAVIAAIAVAIPVLVGQVILMVNVAVSQANQKLMIQQNRDIIAEQAEVKHTLNGTQDKLVSTQEKILEKVIVNENNKLS